MSAFPEYDRYDALGLAELVASKQVRAIELVDACIERIERRNPSLNAVVVTLFERARAEAAAGDQRGPFAGVPFLVKDLVSPVEGARFTRGSRFFALDVADHDSELVRRYRAAGLILTGKTNTPEFGLKAVTEPKLHGPTENPWRIGWTAGGSSGGSAAAVAARIAPMAHGGDGGGSLRIPASCCGVFGFKPTRARTPAGPDRSEGWSGLAVEHALTRSVRDSAALLDATCALDPTGWYAAPAPARPYLAEVTTPPERLRIGLWTRPVLPSNPDPKVIAATEEVAGLCRELGHVVEVSAPDVDGELLARDFLTVVAVATSVDLDESAALLSKPLTRHDFELDTWMVGMLGRTISGVALETARRRLHAASRAVAKWFEEFDVLLTPTVAQPPPRHGALSPPPLLVRVQELLAAARLSPVLRIDSVVEQISKLTYDFIPWTPLANVTGCPSMSVPLSWEDGLPIGTMFTARFGDEATLFRLAGQLEQARPWEGRRPPGL